LKTIIANIIPAIIRKITNHSIDTFLYRYSYISL
jgi:hypothetical protein